ncbi:hypothetical protein AWB79_04099 [Caballeronia hypogeia]|uniref:Lipoprotein n=1 Tax=Caballeronia hypogeia TaxID=1777140 RepID=A0A158BQT8_9BURK|nr:hypothetical protein [Caballeronia hypogeia]SAK72445.1 hypothetical protein AWB79_04099 [Caballeronia hypogeia]
MKLDQSLVQRMARAGVAAVAFAMLTACASAPGASGAAAPLPADSTVATGRIVGKQYLTTVSTGAAPAAGPTVGVGAGGIGGNGWSGGGAGAGLSFDLTNLFQKSPEQTAKVYRYSVQMQDGSKRDVDSTLDLTDGACVTTIDSSAPGYPRLAPAGSC